jgi:hypothetical protein
MARIALKIPPGLWSDDTVHKSAGRWADGSNVRFRLGSPQTVGGWEALTDSLLTGVCRWAFPWTTNDGQLHVAFGTHSAFQLWVGGGIYDITPTGLAAGQIDGTGQAGYGTGPYGIGGYATPTVDDYFPRTWSGGAFGQDLVISPRFGTIYRWDASNTGLPAVAITDAPAAVTYCLVSHTDQIFAFGCSEEVSGDFNALCIRHSGIRRDTEWATDTPTDSTAREYILPGGGKIMGARVIGSYLLVWTNASLFLGTFVGQLGQVWRFDKIGDHCGLIGPNAAVIVGQQAFWISPDGQFYAYALGAAPAMMACPIREDFSDNLAFAQSDKVVASSIGAFGEVRWDYPDARDGVECSRYVAVAVAGPDAGSWYRGQMARTAMVDAGPSSFPLGVTYDGHVYWHERGQSGDGAPLSWFIESADQYLSEDNSLLVRSFWPDALEHVGPVTLTLTSRFKPRGDETVKAYTFASTSDKVDVRMTGRLFRVRLSGSASPSAFRLGAPVFDYVPGGTR